MKLVGTFTGIQLNYAHIQFGAMGVSHNEVVSRREQILQESQEFLQVNLIRTPYTNFCLCRQHGTACFHSPLLISVASIALYLSMNSRLFRKGVFAANFLPEECMRSRTFASMQLRL
jgi:hypothetical protein